MVKIIQRTTDNKYLQSLENDVWVDNRKDAFLLTYKECESVKEYLNSSYTKNQIKEIVDFTKSKPMTDEEKKTLLNLLKNN